jgi:hypothetical protein
MFRKISSAILLLIIAACGIYFQGGTREAHAAPAGLSTVMRQRVLDVTVQITVKFRQAGQPLEAYGLGTLFADGGKQYLITHNHWGEVLQNASLIEIHDVDGKLLVRLIGFEFNQLVRYADPGTLILRAPAELERTSWVPEMLPSGSPVQQGAIVSVALRDTLDRSRVTVMEAVVESNCVCSGLPGYQLRSLEGTPVLHGDSGGGIWVDGKLAGNMWATVKRDRNEQSPAASLPASQNPGNYSDLSFAAAVPAGW